jgi:hypothetical protein
MSSILAVPVALVQLAGVYCFASRAIARVNAAGQYVAGTARFHLQLVIAGLCTLASMALFFSVTTGRTPKVARTLPPQ